MKTESICHQQTLPERISEGWTSGGKKWNAEGRNEEETLMSKDTHYHMSDTLQTLVSKTMTAMLMAHLGSTCWTTCASGLGSAQFLNCLQEG